MIAYQQGICDMVHENTTNILNRMQIVNKSNQ